MFIVKAILSRLVELFSSASVLYKMSKGGAKRCHQSHWSQSCRGAWKAEEDKEVTRAERAWEAKGFGGAREIGQELKEPRRRKSPGSPGSLGARGIRGPEGAKRLKSSIDRRS